MTSSRAMIKSAICSEVFEADHSGGPVTQAPKVRAISSAELCAR
jgi:hypothetical protein